MAKIKLKYVNAFANKRRSNAQLRYYFRRRGQKAIPLPGLPGSEDFMRAYQMALAMLPTLQPIGARRTAPGTINSLVVSYYQSDAWNKLAPDTRKTRRRFIERLRQEHGDKRVALLRREHVELMLAKIARPTTRRHWLKAVRPLLQYAVRAGMGKDDPTAGIETPKLPKSKGHHAWTDAEIAQYRKHWALGTQQRLVLEFALETTSRKGEVVRLGPQHIKDGWIRIERTHDDCPVFSSDARALPTAKSRGGGAAAVAAFGGLSNDEWGSWASCCREEIMHHHLAATGFPCGNHGPVRQTTYDGRGLREPSLPSRAPPQVESRVPGRYRLDRDGIHPRKTLPNAESD